jgi:hypothetical protein
MQTSLCPTQVQEKRKVAMYDIITGNTASRLFAEVQKSIRTAAEIKTAE